MKEITKYSRCAQYLEKLFDMLNEDFFDGELAKPIITLIPSSRSYGHYSVNEIWSVKGEEANRHEINIATGTLSRPIEETVSTLLHEMCHLWNNENRNTQDCSRGGMYHSRVFKEAAESHGLIVERSDIYGYAITKPSDDLIEWILDHDIREIEINRLDIERGAVIGTGSRSATGSATVAITSGSHNYRYQCPKCRAIARSCKPINLICADCFERMI